MNDPVPQSPPTTNPPPPMAARFYVLLTVTLVYCANIADRFVLSVLVEPIKAEFALSDSSVGFLTGAALALFYSLAGLPLGTLVDRTHRRNMLMWSLALWSSFVTLGGFAQNYWQFLLTRIGVGVGQAGATPASHSILADCFRPSERLVAMSVFSLGITLGMGLGGIGGGLIAAHFGWRWVLFLFGFAALPLLFLVMRIREPKRGAYDTHDYPAHNAASLGASLRFIGRNKALRNLIAGATLATFAGQGLVWWTPAFLARSHGFSVAEAGISVGLMNGIGGTFALVLTAVITLWLAKGPLAWQGRFLAVATALITITGAAAYASGKSDTAVLLLWLFVPFVSVHVGPTLALMQNLSPPGMRGTIVAVFLFCANIAGLALAPQLIGLASDFLASRLPQPTGSLGVALALCALTGFWSSFHFWKTGTAATFESKSNLVQTAA